MTVNVARRRAKAAGAGETGRSDGPIGEIGQTLFGCPACGRPLAIGVRRCPSCSARLVMGVRAGRAAMFVTIGLIVGVAFGGGLAATLTAIRLPERDAAVARAVAAAVLAGAAQAQAQAQAQPQAQAAASTAPHAPAITPGSGSSGTGTTVTIPANSASALTQALILNARLSDSTTALRAALAAPKFDAQEVSQLLREASANSVIGLQLAESLNAWSGGTAVGGRMTMFYTAIQATAAEGLGASIRNDPAYRRAATSMVALLAGLGPMDDQARQLAATVGINLPATVSPAP
jgi:pimeloyl-ACP methyl ester carboxylesterase